MIFSNVAEYSGATAYMFFSCQERSCISVPTLKRAKTKETHAAKLVVLYGKSRGAAASLPTADIFKDHIQNNTNDETVEQTKHILAWGSEFLYLSEDTVLSNDLDKYEK